MKKKTKEFTKGQIVYAVISHITDNYSDCWYSYEKRIFDKYAHDNKGKRNHYLYTYTNPDKGWSEREWRYNYEKFIYETEEEAQKAVKRMDEETKKEYKTIEEEAERNEPFFNIVEKIIRNNLKNA